MGHRTAAIAAIFLVWLPLGLPQRTFGQCYSGTTPTRCEPVEQTFSLNREPSVNSTCGKPPASFCTYQYVSIPGVIRSVGCNYTCNSSDAKNAHPASFLTDFPVSSNPTWWQSSNSSNSRYIVSIALDFAALVEVTKVTIQFKTLVPMSFYIEKSVDNNRSYSLFNFFRASCAGEPTAQTITYATEVTPLCTLISSPVDFLDTVFLPANGRPSAIDSITGLSQNLYDFIQATNIRVTLTESFPVAGQNPSYYYAIQDLAVVGRFQCNGHAASITNMACNCEHNTKGINCEQCLDLFNDIPWERNDGSNSFECQACSCNQHSKTCVFDSSMYNKTGGVSGGICVNCTNNTAGIHCETCAQSYYPLPSKSQTDPDVCVPCSCDVRGMNDSGDCQKSGPNAGNCYCKSNVAGQTCNTCKEGYFNITVYNVDGCQDCGCNSTGSLNSSCTQQTGLCYCKSNVIGQKCDYCLPNYYQQSPTDPQGCQPCNCNIGGSLGSQCDLFTGQCPCRNGVTGRDCSIVVSGRFFPLPDYLILEGEFSTGTYQKLLLTSGEGTVYTGAGVASLSNSSSSLLDLGVLIPPSSGWYQATFRYSLQGRYAWSSAILEVQAGPEVGVGAPSCTEPNGILLMQYAQWSVGNSTAISQNLCLRGGRSYRFVLKNFNIGAQEPGRTLEIDSFFLAPLSISGLALFSDSAVSATYNNCVNSLRTLPRPLAVLNACRDTIFKVSTAVFNGTLPCACNTTGSTSLLCNEYGGQCPCNIHVSGQQCGYCTPGYYNFSSAGCQACNCNPNGSTSLICSATNGSCPCVSNVTGQTCSQCAYSYYNLVPGVGCSPCNCHVNGSVSLQCQQETGICPCNPNVAGDKCDHCFNGYYSLTSNTGCRSCNCSTTGTIGGSCDATTGACYCSVGAFGRTCDSCLTGYYLNLTGYCQACNCNPKNSISQSCTNGTCTCIPGASGVTCNECSLGYYTTQTGVCTVCSRCYNQSVAIVVTTNNTLLLNIDILNGTTLPTTPVALLLNSTSTAVSSLCLKKNDTAKLFIAVNSVLSTLSKSIVQFGSNVSQTMDLVVPVMRYAAVVYVNARAASILQYLVEDEVAFATQCTAAAEYLSLPNLESSKDTICQYAATGQLLYDKVVNFSIILQNQLSQTNSSLSKTQMILASVNSTVHQVMVLNGYNMDGITMAENDLTDNQVKMNFVNVSLFRMKNQTELLSKTIAKLLLTPIILPLTDDLTSLWNHANVTLAFVEDLISQVNTELLHAMDIKEELTLLHSQFTTMKNKLLQLTNTFILNSNLTRSLRLVLDTEVKITDIAITNAIAVANNLQAFSAVFSQTVSFLSELLKYLMDLTMVANHSTQQIITMKNIASNFNQIVDVINSTAAVVRHANDKVMTVNSSLPVLMLNLASVVNSSNQLVEEASQANATAQLILSKFQILNNEISTLRALNEQGITLNNQSNQSLISAMSQWNKVKVQLQSFYNQSLNTLLQINSTKTLFGIVQQQANSTASLYQHLSNMLKVQQSRKLQLKASITAVQSSVQYLRQLPTTITTKCTN